MLQKYRTVRRLSVQHITKLPKLIDSGTYTRSSCLWKYNGDNDGRNSEDCKGFVQRIRLHI